MLKTKHIDLIVTYHSASVLDILYGRNNLINLDISISWNKIAVYQITISNTSLKVVL